MAIQDGVILWPAVCGNRSRRDAFWDDAQTVNTNNPDFTLCFQSTALSWGPCAVLWLFAPFFVWYLSTIPYKHGRWRFSPLNAAKSLGAVMLMGLSVVQLAHTAVDLDDVVLAEYLAPAVYIVTHILALFLIRYEFRKGIHSSGVMFCFWLFLLLCNIIPLRTKIIDAVDSGIDDLFGFGLFIILFFFILLEFILHLFADRSALVTETRQRWSDEERQPLLANDTAAVTAAAEEDAKTKKIPCPELQASFLSRITYVWVSRMLLDGYKKLLTAERLWELRPADKATNIISHFYTSWTKSSRNEETRKRAMSTTVSEASETMPKVLAYNGTSSRYNKKPETTWQTNSSILGAVWKSFGFMYSYIALYEVLNIALTFARPLLLDALIGFVENREDYLWRGYLFAFLMFAVTVLRAIINQLHFYGKMLTGQRIRSAITTAVYKKSLVLANSCRKEYSVGSIVNLMSVDAQRIADATFFLHNLWSAPVNVIIAMVMLWNYLGVASLAGLGILLSLMVMNFFLATRIKRLQVMQMKFKDTRTKLTNEILNGIKVLKLYAWEGAFQKKLLSVRDKELGVIFKAALYISGTAISFTCAPVLYTVVSFSIYILASGNALLSAQVAFVSLSLVNSLTRPLSFLPNGIANIVQALVSVNRLENFLNGDELDPDAVTHNGLGDSVIDVKQGTFSWEGEEGPNVLKDISFSVQRGSLTCIVGQVGTGKSSLLSAILGELHKTHGSVNVTGSIAYIPQEAWIRNMMLQKNVLFGKELKDEKYQETIEACALTPDLKILPAGDQTEIGEKGINLSGGQKQRVSLARAVYQDCDVYLLDDPLAAVDAHVGKHIYNKVISKDGCLQYKTRVLVTHGITHLPKADQIIVLKDGQISEIGTYQDLLTHNGAFADLMNTYLNEGSSEGEENSDPEAKAIKEELKRHISVLSTATSTDKASGSEGESDTSTGSKSSTKKVRRRYSRGLSKEAKSAGPDKKEDGIKDKGVEEKGPGRGQRLIDTERTQTGGVKWRVLFSYLRSMGLITGLGIMLSYVLNIGADLGSNIWLSAWSSDSAREAANETFMDPTERVGVYGGLGGLQTLSILGQTMFLALGSVTAARLLHESLLDATVHAPMAFFDTTPLGRILNRFSQDMATVDSQIRFTLMSTLRGFSGMLTTIIAISYTTPIFLAMIIPLAVLYYFLQFDKCAVVIKLKAGSTNAQLQKVIEDTDMPLISCPNIHMYNGTIASHHSFTSNKYTAHTELGMQGTRMVIGNERGPVCESMRVNLTVIRNNRKLLVFTQLRFYIMSSNQLRRLINVRTSPMYSHFGETVAGAISIRAYQQQDVFKKESYRLMDGIIEARYAGMITNRWLSIWLEGLGGLVVLFCALFAVLSRDTITGGLVGLAISYSLQLTDRLAFFLRNTCDLENNVVSVERIHEYSEITPEAPWYYEGHRPPRGWPGEGTVAFDRYSTRYRTGLDLVLKDVTCNIQGGEKVGIVGRTGAGKSSMTLALFRIIEAANGSICIDSLNSNTIGLHDLRSKLTIIPQDPVLFTGSLRFNVDPFNEHSESEIWDAFRHAHLKTFVESLADKLNHECAEGGQNLSVGQRQLVCLARALLRRTKVLVLDEATAAVDLETDDLIQSTIRSEFKNSTVITIAHRINTVMDYDRIMVLDGGNIQEYDSPDKLLENKNSLFYSLCKDAGLV